MLSYKSQKTCPSCRDLSEQIKKVTKDSHVRAENTELMLSFQRGNVSMQQYKVTQFSILIDFSVVMLTLKPKCDGLRSPL